MKDLRDTLRAVVVQAEPVLFDKRACVDRALYLIDEAAEKYRPDLVVFPELFIPGYPFGMNFGFSVGTRDDKNRPDWLRYYRNSAVVPGPETEALAAAAARHHLYLSMGFSERDAVNGTLYNANLIFNPDGTMGPVKRKLKPTGSERVVWGDADRGFFPVTETPWGPLGCLICWESYMPLARMALYEKGVTVFISANTNDNPEWQDAVRHIAREGRCFFINADLFFRKSSYPEGLHEDLSGLPDIVCRGGSCIADPFGHYAAPPLWDCEGFVFAELDMSLAEKAKMELDVCGHYARPDVLRFSFDDR